jgi:hypothetical protein
MPISEPFFPGTAEGFNLPAALPSFFHFAS